MSRSCCLGHPFSRPAAPLWSLRPFPGEQGKGSWMLGRVSDRHSVEPEPRLFAAPVTVPPLQLPALWGEMAQSGLQSHPWPFCSLPGLLAPTAGYRHREGKEQGSLQTSLYDGKVPEWAGFSQPRPVEENEKQMGSIAILPTAPPAPSSPPQHRLASVTRSPFSSHLLEAASSSVLRCQSQGVGLVVFTSPQAQSTRLGLGSPPP